jgi:tight adherence protein B
MDVTMNGLFLLLVTTALGGALLIVIAARAFFQEARAVNRRLVQVTGQAVETEQVPPVDIRTRVDVAVTKTQRGSRIARDLARADLKLTAGEFVLLKLVCALLGALAGAGLSNLILGEWLIVGIIAGALIGVLVALFLPDLYVKMRIKRRLRQFNDALADTIAMLASSLRSGYSLLQAIDLVSKEGSGPIATEFRRVVQEVGLGLSTEAALTNLLRRVPSEDLDLMISAINIQHEVGGNLSQILDSIAHTIRERVRIKGEIRTLTAQGRISGYVITALPIGLGIFLSIINPGYMAPILTFGLPPQAWCCLPVTSGVMIVMGYFAIMKIVDIDI